MLRDLPSHQRVGSEIESAEPAHAADFAADARNVRSEGQEAWSIHP